MLFYICNKIINSVVYPTNVQSVIFFKNEPILPLLFSILQGNQQESDVFKINNTQFFLLTIKILYMQYFLFLIKAIMSSRWCPSSSIQFSSLHRKLAITRIIISSLIAAALTLWLPSSVPSTYEANENIRAISGIPTIRIASAQIQCSWQRCK